MEKSEKASAVPVGLATAKLVNLARQQAETGQMPDESVLKELLARYAWPDCPRGDLALIHELDRSVLMPRFGGYTHLPPRLRRIPGTKFSTPPYYQKLQMENHQASMNASLKKLRDSLSAEQRGLLNMFWKDYLESNLWPLKQEIHRRRTKGRTMECLRSVGGNPALAGHIVYEDRAQYGEIYKLTMIGILLTKGGRRYQGWLIRLLEFFRKEFYRQKPVDPRREFGADQIGQALGLDADQLAVLGKLTQFEFISPFKSQSYGHTVGGGWKIGFPLNIDDIPRTKPLNGYFERALLLQLRHPKWVYDEDRLAHGNQLSPVTTLGDLSLIETMKPNTNSGSERSESVKIFISHSSHDKQLMEALTDLLRTAFAFRTKDILCTSVAGYRLRGGDDTEEALLRSLRDAKLLIGVLSPASLGSSYVLFELGARWGLGGRLIALVARGATMSGLQEPLRSKNALDATNETDVHQLIQNVAEYLEMELEPPHAYNEKIRKFVELAKTASTVEKPS